MGRHQNRLGRVPLKPNRTRRVSLNGRVLVGLRGYFSWWVPYVCLGAFITSIVCLALDVLPNTMRALLSASAFGGMASSLYYRQVRGPKLHATRPPDYAKERKGVVIGIIVGSLASAAYVGFLVFR